MVQTKQENKHLICYISMTLLLYLFPTLSVLWLENRLQLQHILIFGINTLRCIISFSKKKKKNWCIVKYGDPYSKVVLCI